MPDIIAFDTEDDSMRFSKSNQDHPGYEKVCTQVAAIDFRSGQRFHLNPTASQKRRRGRYTESVWDVAPFLEWLETRGSVRCYAHNLSYDIGNIWRDHLDDLDITMVGNRLVRAKWRNVTLLDSSNMWPMPLAKVGKAVGLEKLEFDDQSMDYVFRDVEIVGKAIGVSDEIAASYGIPPKSTLGSMAVGIWSGPVMGGGNWQCSIPSVREAYYGGRVELFRPEAAGKNIYYCDINSLYPAQMTKKFPAGADLFFGFDSIEEAERVLCDPRRELYGVAHVDLDIPMDTRIGPLPVKREKTGEVCFPIGPVSGWWTTHEIRYALRKGAKLRKLREAYGSQEGEAYYADFVHTFYRLRQDELNKPDGDPGKILFYKLLMNNLYGQLGMRGSVTRSIHLTEAMVEPDEDGNLILLRDGIPFGSKLLTDVEIPLPDHVNYMHASYVTSYGRLALMEYMDLVGAENLIYCDTDSIFFTWDKRDLPFALSTNLGEMKLEDRPRWVQCRAPKMYRYQVEKGKVTKAKGVPKKMQDVFYDEGVASFWQPWRLKESIACADRIPNEDDEEVKILGVWREVKKRVVSAYDKKAFVDGRYVPKTMDDIGPGDEDGDDDKPPEDGDEDTLETSEESPEGGSSKRFPWTVIPFTGSTPGSRRIPRKTLPCRRYLH